ncbi:MAG: TonB-dependent receptor [Nitrospirota bacterium]
MNILRILIFFCLLSFFLPAIIVNAYETTPSELTQLSIEELMELEVATVYGASKYEQKVTEAPSSVSIITSDEIKKYGYRTLADILRSVRGLYVTYDRNYSYVGVRGFNRPGDYNSRILLLIDGHRINDNIFDSFLIGQDAIIDVDLIDRVEVIRGPGSSLYGSSAFFAVVNVITKRGADIEGTEVSGEVGSLDTYKGRVSYGDKSENGFEGIVSGATYDSKGHQRLYYKEYDDPATNNGVAEDADYERYKNAFAKLSYLGFTLEGAYQSRTKGIPTGSFGTDFNDPDNMTVDDRRYLDLKYNQNISSQWDISAQLYYDYYKYVGDYIYSDVVNKDESYGEWCGSEVKLTTTVLSAHRIVTGIEYKNNFRQDQINYDEDPYVSYLEDERDSQSWAYYIQDEISLSKKLLLNTGIRYDYYETFGSECTTVRLKKLKLGVIHFSHFENCMAI